LFLVLRRCTCPQKVRLNIFAFVINFPANLFSLAVARREHGLKLTAQRARKRNSALNTNVPLLLSVRSRICSKPNRAHEQSDLFLKQLFFLNDMHLRFQMHAFYSRGMRRNDTSRRRQTHSKSVSFFRRHEYWSSSPRFFAGTNTRVALASHRERANLRHVLS